MLKIPPARNIPGFRVTWAERHFISSGESASPAKSYGRRYPLHSTLIENSLRPTTSRRANSCRSKGRSHLTRFPPLGRLYHREDRFLELIAIIHAPERLQRSPFHSLTAEKALIKIRQRLWPLRPLADSSSANSQGWYSPPRIGISGYSDRLSRSTDHATARDDEHDGQRWFAHRDEGWARRHCSHQACSSQRAGLVIIPLESVSCGGNWLEPSTPFRI